MAARPAPSSSTPAPRTVIPKLTNDPSASLEPSPLIVQAAGATYTIEAYPAVTWLRLIMDEQSSYWDFFPALADDDAQEQVQTAIMSGNLDFDELRELALDMVACAAGKPWWVVSRLVTIAAGNWDYLGGELGLRGVDATRMSLGGWLDVVLHLLLRSMDQKEHTKFLMSLEKIPAGEAATLPEPEMSAADFGALMR